MKPFLGLFLFLLLAPGAVAAAEGLPVMQPQGLFVDADPAASYLSPPTGNRARFRQLINAAIQKNPRNVSALTHRAYLFMESGDHARAKRDYDAALAAAEPGGSHEGHVLWSRGWASYEHAQYAATFSDWSRAIELHGGRPYWVAYSLALLYWTTEQQDLALEWYAAAVASDPRWGDSEGVAYKTRKWSPPQHERMQGLFTAWSEGKAEK